MDDTSQLHLEHAERVRMELDEMRNKGVLVDLNVRGLSMFVTQVHWEHDLGIPPGDARRKRLRPGTKNLLPDSVQNALRSNEVRLRRNLAQFSRKISVFGAWDWIPHTAYATWLERHEALVEEQRVLKEDIIANYDYYVEKLREDFSAIAAEAWHSLTSYANGYSAGYEWSQFQQEVIAKAEAKLPGPSEIDRRLTVEVIPGLLMLPSEYEAELVERTRQLEERERLRAETRAAEAEAQARADVAMTQARLDMETAQIRADYERAQIAEMHRQEMARARDLLARTVSPFQEVIDSLRSDIYATTMEVAAAINKHGHVRGKTVQKIEGMLQTFRLLNVAGDYELEEQLQHLGNSLEVEGADTKRDAGVILAALHQVARVAIEQGEGVADRLRPTQEGLIEL